MISHRSVSWIFCLLVGLASLASAQVHFNPVDGTGSSCAIVIQNATINGVTLQTGDEIGVFDGSLCVGAAVYNGSFSVNFSAWGKFIPPGQSELPGYTVGHAMSFRVWQASSGVETGASASYAMGGKFGDPASIVTSLSATIVSPSSEITITTSPTGREFVVDGTTYTSSQTFTWDEGSSHTINIATSPQDGGTGVRYNYASWSDGGAQSHSVTVGSSNATVTANFITQYQLTVSSAYGTTSGSGWYNAGASATFSVTPSEIDEGGGMRRGFTGWTGAGSASYTGPVVEASVNMTSPVTETAIWETQYQLTVNSTHGSPQGAGWYAAGSTAGFSVSTPEVDGTTRYAFTGWSGDHTGSSASASITMDAAKTVAAGWKTQYQVAVTSAHGTATGSGWYDAGSSAAIGVSPSTVAGASGTQYVFTGWTGDHSGSSATASVTVDAAKAIAAGWKTQYYLSTAENPDAGGSMTPAPPGGWYDSGASVSIDAIVAAGYEWGGWSGDLSGTTKPTSITLDGPKSVTANFGKTVTVTFKTSPTGRSYTVDGTTYTSQQRFTWLSGSSHTLSGEIVQAAGSGTRYALTEIAIGSTLIPITATAGTFSETFTVPTEDVTVTGNFDKEYQLTVNSAHGSPQGAGWYTDGSTASFSVTTPVSASIMRYVFTSWSGDHSGTAASASITMNGPKTVTAGWKTQYPVAVSSAHGTTTGSGWYDAGSTASISITPTTVAGASGTQYVFTGWSGDHSGSSATASLTVDSGKSITANWNTQYYLSTVENPDAGGNMTPAPPGGWYNAGTVVDLTATATPSSDWRFISWSGDASGSGASTTVTMTAAKSVVANFAMQGQVRIDTDPPGLRITVDGTDYTAPQDFNWVTGSTHVIAAPAPQDGGNGLRYHYDRWSDDGAQSHEITVGSTSIYTANFTKAYYLGTSFTPASGGSVTATPAGPWHESGTVVSLEAIPADGYQFKHWTGDHTGADNPITVTMDRSKGVIGHFEQDDLAPALKNCYPCAEANAVPINTPVELTIEDPQGGSGVDRTSIQVSVNGTAIVSDGEDVTGGQVTIQSHSPKYTLHYQSATEFTADSDVVIRVQAHDLASVGNALDHSYAFHTGTGSADETHRECIGQGGGTMTCAQTGVEITIPPGALGDSTEIGIATMSGYPQLPDGVTGLAMAYHFWPDGLQFQVQVRLHIPFTQEDLDSANVGSALELPVYYFASSLGQWVKLNVICVQGNTVVVAVNEFCYLLFGRELSAVEEVNTSPIDFTLAQNFPNPFNPETRIAYVTAAPGEVSLIVFDVRGKAVRTLKEGQLNAGHHHAVWQGRDDSGNAVSSGVYFYVLRCGSQVLRKKCVFMK